MHHRARPKFNGKEPTMLSQVKTLTKLKFKSITRIEKFIFVYFKAMNIQSLIERYVRMVKVNSIIMGIPLYSEERECSSPHATESFLHFTTFRFII